MASPPTTLDQIVVRARGLYSLPAVAMKVLDLTSSPTVDSQALKQCIENDPALTAKLLRVVNSSLFGLSRQVSDLHQALALLGTKPLKLLVLGFSLPDRLLSGIARDHLARYWRDTLTKAVAAREISEILWQLPGDEAFLAGLLADIGMLMLVQDLGEPYSALLEQVDRDGADVSAREREWLGFDHTMLSAHLLTCWGLPTALVEAVAAPAAVAPLCRLPASRRPLPQILHLADLLVALVARRRIGVLPDLLEVGDAYCGLTRSELTELVKHVEPTVAQLAEVLLLDLPDGLDYSDILIQAHARLAEEASGVVGDLVEHGPGPKHVGRDPPCAGPSSADTVWKSTSAATAVEPSPPVHEPAPKRPAGPGSEARQGGPTAADESDENAAAALLAPLTALVTCCRSQRCELSLLLLQINHGNGRARPRRTGGTTRIAAALEALLRNGSHPDAVVVRMAPARFAMLLPGCDRQLAIEIGRRAIGGLRATATAHCRTGTAVPTLSIGAATVAVLPKNFSARALIESAERCLYAAQLSQSSAVKSIEVY